LWLRYSAARWAAIDMACAPAAAAAAWNAPSACVYSWPTCASWRASAVRVAATDCWYEDSIWVRAARVAASIVCVVVPERRRDLYAGRGG
jgi:hypothetical protein